jgi:hypothetical protein
VDHQQVIAFLDWLTAGGNKMEYALVNPTLAADEKADFYRNGERVTVEQMQAWANNWLEDTGRVRHQHSSTLWYSERFRSSWTNTFPSRLEPGEESI